MKDVLKKKGATDRSVVIGIAIIVLLVIVFGLVRFSNNAETANNQAANVKDALGMSDDSDTDEDMMDNTGEMDDMQGEEMSDDSIDSLVVAPSTMTVKIPVLASDAFEGQSIKRGCDTVVFVNREVAQSPAILNATMKEMFTFNESLGFLPGNFIATRDQLSFDRAEINGGVAQVYLTGAIGTLGGACDDPRVQVQIEEAALQFSTVNSVEIFLNGIRYEAESMKG